MNTTETINPNLYINPILSFLICATFAILLLGIKGRKQITAEDEKGLNWFIGAFLLFGIAGLVYAIAIKNNLDETNIFIGIKVILSTLNSVFFLKAISFIEVKPEYSFSRFVKEITAEFALIFSSVIVIGGTIFLVFYIEKPSTNNWIWFLDILFSFLSITALAIVIRQAFKERNMQHFQWLVFGMLGLLLLTQILNLLHIEKSDVQDYNRLTILITVISVSYKTMFCMLILVLLYSWQIMGLNKLSVERAKDKEEFSKEIYSVTKDKEELSLKLQALQSNKETISEDKLLLNEEIKELKKEIQITKQEFSTDKEIPIELTSHSLKFVFSKTDEVCVLKLSPPLSRNWIEIDFSKNIKPFKKLLKLAINKKYSKAAGDEYLNFQESKNKVASYGNEKDSIDYLKYFEDFTYKDKEIIEKIISPQFEDFTKFYIRNKHSKICLTIPEINISLPQLSVSTDEISADEIFIQFHKEYIILQASRGN